MDKPIKEKPAPNVEPPEPTPGTICAVCKVKEAAHIYEEKPMCSTCVIAVATAGAGAEDDRWESAILNGVKNAPKP